MGIGNKTIKLVQSFPWFYTRESFLITCLELHRVQVVEMSLPFFKCYVKLIKRAMILQLQRLLRNMYVQSSFVTYITFFWATAKTNAARLYILGWNPRYDGEGALSFAYGGWLYIFT